MKSENSSKLKRSEDPDFKVECSSCHRLIYGGYLDSNGECVDCRPVYGRGTNKKERR